MSQKKITGIMETKIMANKTYKPLLTDSIKAISNLNKNRFIGFDGDYCQDGAKALGVIDVETEKDQFVPAALCGILLVECGGTIAVGDEVASDATGRAVVLSTRAMSNGFALDPGEEGDIVRIVRGI